MGAGTVTIPAQNYSPRDGQGGTIVKAAYSFSSSYATGGDTLTAAQVGLAEINEVIVKGDALASGPNRAIVARYTSVGEGAPSGLMLAFWQDPTGSSQGPLVEVPNGTNLSAFSVALEVIGF